MTIKQRLALWRKRRHGADDAIARLNQRIKTRVIRLAARPALAAYLAREFGLRFTSGWRSVAHNAAVAGVPGSWHTRGSRSKPGAVDLVGPMDRMQAALAWARAHVPNLAEAMIHDVGSGQHLHLAGTGVMNWHLPRRGILKGYRKRRAEQRKKRATADRKIAAVKREQAANKVQPAKGIDVSNHQGRVDFIKVKANGYAFCWVKASEGIGFTDAFFRRNVHDARTAGLKVGAYHFCRPRAGRTGTQEARAFHAVLQTANLGKGDLRPVLDVEATELDQAGTWRYIRAMLLELERLTDTKPLFYTFPAFNGGVWPADFTDLADLWVAHFQVAKPKLPAPWKSYAAWQHTDHGRAPGVTGDVDLNKTPDLKELIA